MVSNQVITTINVLHSERNRKTVFWRGILVAPVFIFVMAFAQNASSGWEMGTAGVIVLPTALAIIFRKKYPSFVLSFNQALVELSTRLAAYLLLLNDDYPSIERNPSVVVTFPDVEGGAKLNRALPLVKWFLAVPHYIVLSVYLIIALLVSVIAWVQTWSTGKYPSWASEIVLGTLQYLNRLQGYMFLLVTDEYPTFRLK